MTRDIPGKLDAAALAALLGHRPDAGHTGLLRWTHYAAPPADAEEHRPGREQWSEVTKWQARSTCDSDQAGRAHG